MIYWLIKHFSPKKAQYNPDCVKPEVHEPKNNNIKSVSNKFLIVGLGNIGAEYVNTRHNIGFKILDFFAKKDGFLSIFHVFTSLKLILSFKFVCMLTLKIK